MEGIPQILCDDSREIAFSRRAPEEEPLNFRTLVRDQEVHLVRAFDTFGQDVEAEGSRGPDQPPEEAFRLRPSPILSTSVRSSFAALSP